MLIEHLGKRPVVHKTTYLAPSATIRGAVTIGEGTCVLDGVVITAESGPVVIGRECVVMEHAIIRGVRRHPVAVGNHVLVGPHAHLSGCEVDDSVFIATGASIFNGARVGTRSVVRINGIVHIRTSLPPDSVVPIGWVAIGDPPEILPSAEHERISRIMAELDFPMTVFGVGQPAPGETTMPERMRRYARALARQRDDAHLTEG